MSVQAGRDCVSIQIDEDLRNLSVASFEPSIFKVYDRLRAKNNDAYGPEMISIGPYHHGKDKLIPMEKHKLRLLKQLLNRRHEDNADRYVSAMRKLEEPVRRCYADPIDLKLDSNKFVKMMLLDSCFIIELLRKIRKIEGNWKDEPIFRTPNVLRGILRDLTSLLENQLPFFVLVEFMKMSRLNNEEAGGGGEDVIEGLEAGEAVIDMSLSAFHLYGYAYRKPDVSHENIKHLLDLFRLCWYSSFAQMGTSNADSKIDLNYIKPATELKEAGVEFKCAQGQSLSNGMKVVNVHFQNGVMELPRMYIDRNTEVIVRNLIACEQYLPVDHERYITNYYALIDRLVDSSKDVEILRRHRIIEHTLGDDSVVSAMINNVVSHTSSTSIFTYAKVLNDLNEHCKRRRNAWIANLKHNYFNTPWAWISFLAAVILILFTLTQTIFSVLSYVAPKY